MRLRSSKSGSSGDRGTDKTDSELSVEQLQPLHRTEVEESGLVKKGSLLGEHGLMTDGARARREFSRSMEALRKEANGLEEEESIRTGWKLGAEDFLDWILEKVEVNPKEAHSKRERDETEQSRAARIVRDELKKLGWTKTELKRRRKGDPWKVRLARLLRHLEMGTWTHVSNRLYHQTP